MSEVSIAERAQVWDQKKKEKNERMRQLNEQREIQKCTFQPKIKRKKRVKGGSSGHAQQSEFLKEGLSEYFHRVERAKRMKAKGGVLGYKGHQLPELESRIRHEPKSYRKLDARSKSKNRSQKSGLKKGKRGYYREGSIKANQNVKDLRKRTLRGGNESERYPVDGEEKLIFSSNQQQLFPNMECRTEPGVLGRVGSPPSSTFSSKFYENLEIQKQNSHHMKQEGVGRNMNNNGGKISESGNLSGTDDDLDLQELLNRKKAKLMKKKKRKMGENENEGVKDSRHLRQFEMQTKCLVQGLFSSNETGQIGSLAEKNGGKKRKFSAKRANSGDLNGDEFKRVRSILFGYYFTIREYFVGKVPMYKYDILYITFGFETQ